MRRAAVKLTKTRHSASIAGRAPLKKSRGIGMNVKRNRLRTLAKGSSILNIVPDTDRVKKEKIVRVNTPDVSTSTDNFSTVGSAESYYIPNSRIPLVIDSPAEYCGQLASSFADVSLESSDAEGSTPASKILQRKVLKKVPEVKKQFKRKHASSSASVSSEEDISSQDKDIGTFPVIEWGLLIAVLSHPTSVKMSGPALFQVISGSVKILGYVVEQFHGIMPIFSSSKVMSLDIKTERTESICRQASHLQVVKDVLLQNKVPEHMADRILDSCDNSSVILAFRKNFKSSDIHFISSLMPNVFDLKIKKEGLILHDFKDFGFITYPDNSGNLDFPQCENFITDVFSSIKDSDEKNTSAPRIIVQGMKGVGKSTFLRYTINRILNGFDAIYYLDGDPGQSEFTPAGCVSLVKVTTPLLGPPFTHQTTPEKMYFLGTANIQDVADKYSTCMRLLYEYYKEKCAVIPLFVNTMGWVVGKGLKLLQEIKSFVEPTHIVKILDDQIRGGHGTFRTDSEPLNSCAKEYIYGRFSPTDDPKLLMNPADRRNLSILSYLGKCQKLYTSVTSLNSIKPYGIRWRDMALYVGDHKHINEHILYAFNASWVALVSVNESLIMECDDPTLPKLLSEEPVGADCYGFGVIRAIDVVKKVFFIITPEPAERLKKVNALVKSNIQLPSVLFTHQDVRNLVHYITGLTGQSSIASKNVPRRKYRPKKSEIFDQ